MSFVTKSLLASAALLFSSSLPVFSQSLAEEVIEEYFAEARQSGVTIDPGIKTVSGATVEWKDVIFGMPDGQGVMTWEFIRAKEIGDGRVSVSYPDEVAFKTTAKDEVPAINATVDLAGVEHIISGTADARRHDFTAPSISYGVNSDDSSFDMNVEMSGVQGMQMHSGDDIRHFSGDFSADNLRVNYDMDDKDVKMSMKMDYQDFAIDFDADSITEETAEDLLNGKRNFKFNYSMGAGTSITDMNQPDFVGVLTAASDGGQGSISVSDGVFKMSGDARAAAYELKFTEMPLPPFQAEIDIASTSIEIPLKKTDTVVPAKIMFNLSGLKASDTLWGMVDPTGSLPRDKANLNIDLTANMKWLVDLVKADQAEGMPAEVQDVTINDITLQVAGAHLHGTGSAIVDNSKFPPEPVGTVDLDLKGGIGLLDKLVALGLVPADQGEMVKMMSGMFTLPGGDGSDHLTSKIEMKEGGSILVNGNPVK